MKLHELEARLSTVSDEKLRRLLARAQKEGPEVALKFILAEVGKRGLWDLVDPEDHSRSRAVPPERERDDSLSPGGEIPAGEAPPAINGGDKPALSVGTENFFQDEAPKPEEEAPAVRAYMNEDPEIHAQKTMEFVPIFSGDEISSIAPADAGRDTGNTDGREEVSDAAMGGGDSSGKTEAESASGLPEGNDSGSQSGSPRPAPDEEIQKASQSSQWLAEEASRQPFFLIKVLFFLLTLGGLLRFLSRLAGRR